MRELRVATLNIWNRSGPWDARLAAIRDALGPLAPDVLGLQEVLRPTLGEGLDQAALIADGFGYQIAYGAAWEAGGIEFGNAALSRFPIALRQVIRLPDLATDERRCILATHLETDAGLLPFFVTHLNWRFDEGYVREAQVKRIAEVVRDLSPEGALPAVLVGDFNAEAGSDEIRYLRGLSSLGARSIYFTDAFAAAGDGSLGSTFSRSNPFADLGEPDRRIDYIFVRGPARRGLGDVSEARVCFDRPLSGSHPSDHFGVTALVRVS